MELATSTYDFLLTLFLVGMSVLAFGLACACLFVATNVSTLAAVLATFGAVATIAAGLWCLRRDAGHSKGRATGLGWALLAIATCLCILLALYVAGSAMIFYW